MEAGIRQFLEGVGERFPGDDLERTPERVADAWAEDLIRGYADDPDAALTYTEAPRARRDRARARRAVHLGVRAPPAAVLRQGARRLPSGAPSGRPEQGRALDRRLRAPAADPGAAHGADPGDAGAQAGAARRPGAARCRAHVHDAARDAQGGEPPGHGGGSGGLRRRRTAVARCWSCWGVPRDERPHGALGLLLAAVQAPPPAEIDAGFARLAAAAGQGTPLVRIGLDVGSKVTVSGSRPFRIVDPVTGRRSGGRGTTRRSPWSPKAAAAARWPACSACRWARSRARRRRRPRPRAWARSSPAAGARGLRPRPRRLARAPGCGGSARGPGRARRSPARGRGWRRAGSWRSRRRSGRGSRCAWWTRTGRRWPRPLARVAVVPEAGGSLQVEGKAYRGIVELRISPYGTVRAINWIERETLPARGRPGGAGARDLAAARGAEGPGGRGAHLPRGQPGAVRQGGLRPLRNAALPGLRGDQGRACALRPGRRRHAGRGAPVGGGTHRRALHRHLRRAHRGRGGHLRRPEGSLPEGRALPRGERRARAASRSRSRAWPQSPRIDATGTDVTREWAWLRAAGHPARHRRRRPSEREAHSRLDARSGGARGRFPPPPGPPKDVATFAEAAAAVAADLGWDERAQVLLLPGDAEALLRDAGPAVARCQERRTLAYLAWMEAVRPVPTETFGWDAPPDPARARLAPGADRRDLRRASPRGGSGGWGRGDAACASCAAGRADAGAGAGGRPLRLRAGGRALPVARLRLVPAIAFASTRTRPAAPTCWSCARPSRGSPTTARRWSTRWEVRKTRREIEEAMGKRVRVGTLRDLKVVRRGVSGRIVALEVVGSRGRAAVRGFDVRNLLDLRESLTAFEIQRDAEGRHRGRRSSTGRAGVTVWGCARWGPTAWRCAARATTRSSPITTPGRRFRAGHDGSVIGSRGAGAP